MGFRLDTRDLEEGARVDTWTREMRRLCSPMSTKTLSQAPFQARVDAQEIGRVGLRNIEVDPYNGRQTKAAMALVRHERYVLTIATNGHFRMSQFGRDVELDSGQGVLHSTMDHGEYEHLARAGALIAVVPADMLRDRLAVPEDYCACRLERANGSFRILRDLMVSLQANADGLDQAERDALSICFADLAAAALAGAAGDMPRQGSAVQRGHLYRIKSYVEVHLGDAALAPEAVARANDISTRYLHGLFRLEGCSFGGWLRDRRLEKSHAALESARLANTTIADIAHRHGFRSTSHFADLFRRRFGMTPRDSRQQARAGSDDGGPSPHFSN